MKTFTKIQGVAAHYIKVCIDPRLKLHFGAFYIRRDFLNIIRVCSLILMYKNTYRMDLLRNRWGGNKGTVPNCLVITTTENEYLWLSAGGWAGKSCRCFNTDAYRVYATLSNSGKSKTQCYQTTFAEAKIEFREDAETVYGPLKDSIL